MATACIDALSCVFLHLALVSTTLHYFWWKMWYSHTHAAMTTVITSRLISHIISETESPYCNCTAPLTQSTWIKHILKSFERNWGHACQDFSPAVVCSRVTCEPLLLPYSPRRSVDSRCIFKWWLVSHVSVISEPSEVNRQTADITGKAISFEAAGLY